MQYALSVLGESTRLHTDDVNIHIHTRALKYSNAKIVFALAAIRDGAIVLGAHDAGREKTRATVSPEPMTCNMVLAVVFLRFQLADIIIIFCAMKFRPQNCYLHNVHRR